MQVRCIKAAYGHELGDLVDVPDGASVSPVYFEPVTPPPVPAPVQVMAADNATGGE